MAETTDRPQAAGGFMNTKQVCEFWSVTPGTVQNWRRAGLLHPVTVGNGQNRYARAEVEALGTTEPTHPRDDVMVALAALKATGGRAADMVGAHVRIEADGRVLTLTKAAADLLRDLRDMEAAEPLPEGDVDMAEWYEDAKLTATEYTKKYERGE